jgi:nucleoside-diphosphate-sugar epimerase
MSRFLVTGGAGFIGSHLVRALLDRGDDVTVLDDFSTGRRENLAEIAGRFRLVEGSILDPGCVRTALEGVSGVLHEAAMPSVPKSVALPRPTHHANIVGTLTLLEGCRQAGVRRVVYAASSSAYGDQEAERKSEDLTPRPLSPYAVQKLTGEYYCRVFTHLYGLECIGLRYFNVFGPRQDPKSQYAAVIPAFVTRLLAGQPPIIYGDGRQSRDFTFVRNVVEANLAALAAPASVCGEIYNAACGSQTSLLELYGMIAGLLGSSILPEHAASRAGDVHASCADPRLAASALGFTARISVLDGLQETVAWYRDRAI